MPTPDVELIWPPPGLEPMRGRARELAGRMGAADALLFAALFAFSLSSTPMGPQASGPALLSGGLAVIGSLMFARGAVGIWRASREGGSSVWRGYTWLTIAEVMVDRRGDTGALIAGAGAFAGLTADTRNGLRIARLASGALHLAAGLLPLPVFFTVGFIGGSDAPGMLVSLAIALLPSMVLLAFASVTGSAERVALRPYRERQLRMFERRTDAIKLSDEWYASFDRVREGQTLGRGPAGGVMRAWALGAAVSVVIIGGVLTLMPVWFLAAVGSTGTFARPPVFSSNLQKVQQYAYLRAFTPAVDSTITPERAGEAMHSLNERGPRGQRPAYVRPPAHTYPELAKPGPALFPKLKRAGGSWPSAPVLALAKSGLTPQQRTYVASVASNPLWDDFGIVARARRVDIAAGTFITPFPADVSPLDVQITRFGATTDLTYASTVRAASYLAEGHPADAERALRETIAFGFRLIDDGNSSMDPLLGVMMVGSGGDALANLYELTGNPNGPRLRALADTASRHVNVYPASIEHDIGSRDTPRGIRLASMEARAVSTCGTLRGLLFVPPASYQRSMNILREQLAHSPAEEALFDLNAQILDRPLNPGGNQGFTASLILTWARISGTLLNAPHIPSCMLLMPGQRPIF